MDETPTKKVKMMEGSFKEEWEVLFFFILHNDKPKCLICKSSLKCMRKSSIERHYKTIHAEHYDTFTGQDRNRKLEELKLSLHEQHTTISADEEEDEGCDDLIVRASYKVALRLARSGKPFMDGQLVKDILVDVVETLHPALVPVYSKISLSRRTIVRRISDMAENLRDQLAAKANDFLAFSIALDESTDIGDTAQLAIFVRGVDKRLSITEELLDLISMKDTTTGEDILEAVETAIAGLGLQWVKLASVTTDGAPAMRGSKKTFIGLLRKKLENPLLPAIHCFAHQEALCAKAVDLLGVMSVVTRSVNYVRSHGLTHRQFKEFLASLEEEFSDVPYFTEVRWLSRGRVLLRFFQLLESISTFLELKGRAEPLLSDPKWIASLAFLVDLTSLLNDLNLKLQGADLLITDMCSKIKAFRKKLELMKGHLMQSNTAHFPTLQSVLESGGTEFAKYVNVIETLETEFTDRFQDIVELQPVFDIFVKPFSINISDVPSDMQFELLDLQNDDRQEDLFFKSKSLRQYYQNLPSESFPKIHREAAKVLSMFGSTSICERFFSVLGRTKSKLRPNLRNALRIAVSRSISPDINAIIAKQKRKKSE